jgi:MFS family permease
MPTRPALDETKQSLSWSGVLQGVSLAWRDPVVRSMLLLEVVYFSFADGPITVGIPLFVKDVLHAGPAAYGYIRTANYLGLMVGALWLGRNGRHVHKGRVILLGWLGFGLSLIGYPLFHALAPALVAAFVANMVGNLIPMCEGTFIQERVPRDKIGRVSGVWNMIAPGWGVFSGLAGGALARAVPAAMLILFGAVVSCGNALLGLRAGMWRRE